MPKTVKLRMTGADCAACAQEAADAVGKLDGVLGVRLNYPASVVYVTVGDGTDEKKMARLFDGAAKSAEPGISLEIYERKKEEEENAAPTVLRLALGGALFIAALVLRGGKTCPWLYAAAYIVLGIRVMMNVIKRLRHPNIRTLFDENLLMLAASLGAMGLGQYREAAEVMFLYELGEFLCDEISSKTRKSLRSLMEMREGTARLRDGTVISPEEIAVGDELTLLRGEAALVDGVLLSDGTFSTAAITGESLPRDLAEGEAVFAGYINEGGAALMRATAVQDDSAVSRMMDLIEEIGSNKAKTQKFITRFAAWYTPAVMTLAAAICFIPPIFSGYADFTKWAYRALVFLTVSCPCALVLSVPLAYFAQIGAGARRGILIKGGSAIEALAQARTVAFDKTGTVTSGEFIVTGFKPCETDEDGLKEALAITERMSAHPLAKAVSKAVGEACSADGYEYLEQSGRGIRAQKNGDVIFSGSCAYLEENGISVPAEDGRETRVYCGRNGRFLGYCTLADGIKEEAAEAVKELKKLGLRTVILTGDGRAAAEKAADEAGADGVFYSLTPEEKVEKLRGLSENGTTVFAGDGINDAPVIASAGAGIAMGAAGSAAAAEAADIVIADDDLRKIPRVIRSSRKTKRIVYQNMALCIAAKSAVLILGALGLAGMGTAVLADVGVAILAVANSVRAAG